MIKTTLVGHACLLIQSKETTILTDPVWFDYLWEEINVLCPSIVLQKDKVPPLDVLNLSHRHQDHFDVRTLAYLAQNKRILTPDTIGLAPQDDLLLDIRINQEVLAKRTLWPAEGGIHHVRGYRASGANYKRSGLIPEYVEFVLTRGRGKECPI